MPLARRPLLLAAVAAPLLLGTRPASALTWDHMTVDFPGMGNLSSIAVDASGRPHIAYRDYLQGFVKYGRKNDGNSWQVWIVDGSGFAGSGLSLALDSAGNPHISYFRRDHAIDTGDLMYAKGTCTPNGQSASCSFSRVMVDQEVHSSNSGGNSSIAIDSSGIPHIGYVDTTDQQLRWARKLPDIGWDKTNVVHLPSGNVSLVPDADGFPHIAYEDRDNNRLRYVRIVCHFILCGWSFETIDQGLALTPILKRSATGRSHVAYRNAGYIRYAFRTCSGDTCTWSAPQAVAQSGPGLFPGLALDTAGAPVITFVRPEHFWYELVHATRWRFGWTLEVVNTDASVAINSSIAIDGSNRRHISYPGQSDQSMRYVKGTVVSPPTTVFSAQ